ncbi:hypothetical protein BaRGS_00025364 [Batillaria attramentaria]|uniref:TIR domain-containing protein n=1 Tax=Batillaria attramentaria TaxID=370345 RepID=A0ABD0K8M6_9CAEN
MGNCLSDEAKGNSKEEPALQELKYLDRQQHGQAATRSGSLPAEGPHGYDDPGMMRPGYVMPPGYLTGMYPAYGGYPTMGHPMDPAGMYYQPRAPMLVVDPYSNYAYEIDGEGYEVSNYAYEIDGEVMLEEERRHHRRKRDHDRTKSARKDGDDEDKDDDKRAKEGDKKRERKRESTKTSQQNGGPTTANTTSPSSTGGAPTSTTVSPVAGFVATQVVQAATASSAAPPIRQKPPDYVPRDVMISYSRSDHATMTKIKDALEAAGLSVWVDVADISAGGDFLSMIGEAIIDAKAVKSRYCRDEVALAYVSNTAIFPVNISPKHDLVAIMDTGLKLQLAGYKWTSLEHPDNRDDNIRALVSTMKAEMDKLRQEQERVVVNSLDQATSSAAAGGTGVSSLDDVELGVGEGAGRGRSPPQSPQSDTEVNPLWLRELNRAPTVDRDDGVGHVMPEHFWSDRFGVSDYVDWDRFSAGFLEEFRDPIQQTFSEEDKQQLMVILKREMEVEADNRLYKYQFIAFCSQQGEATPVWQRVQEQARESFAMREVFSMDSSVRVEAIENLGKFRSAAVIDALRDLLTDPDANVRAVATVSLARTDANDPVTVRHIMRMLTDKDRLVREAGCLALGHLKARQAISKLTHIWRNDVISHVRDAAAAALRQIGGQEVEDVMRVTKVLAEEIRTLTEME